MGIGYIAEQLETKWMELKTLPELWDEQIKTSKINYRKELAYFVRRQFERAANDGYATNITTYLELFGISSTFGDISVTRYGFSNDCKSIDLVMPLKKVSDISPVAIESYLHEKLDPILTCSTSYVNPWWEFGAGEYMLGCRHIIDREQNHKIKMVARFGTLPVDLALDEKSEQVFQALDVKSKN